MRDNKKEIVNIYIFLFIQLFVWGLSLLFSLGNFNIIECKIFLIVLFFECVCISFIDKKFNIFQLFLLTLFTFNISRIFFDLLGLYDFREFQFRSFYKYFSDENSILTLKALISFLSGVSLGWIISVIFISNNSKNDYFHVKKKCNFLPIYRKIFYLLVIIDLIKVILIVKDAMKYGYVTVVHLGLMRDDILSYFKYVDILFNAFAMINMYYANDKEEFKKISYIFMIPIFTYIFTGQRGQAIYTLLILLWIWNTYYQPFKLKKIGILGLIVIFFSQFIEIYRKSMNYVGGAIFAAGNIFVNFFYGTGVSLGVLQSVIFFEGSFNNKIPFFLGYFVDFFHPVGNYSQESLINGNYLAFHLSHKIIGDGYFNGYTIGTNIIAELYELVQGNMFLLSFGGILLILISYYFIKRLYKNTMFFALGFAYLSRFIYSPRDSVGKIFTRSNIYMLIVLLLIELFEKIFNEKKRRLY